MAALVGLLAVQPAIAHVSGTPALLIDAAVATACLIVFLTLCRRRRERQVGIFLFAVVVAANGTLYSIAEGGREIAALAFQGAVAVFLGFAVVVVVRLLARTSVIRGDDVLGAVGGYILAALAWSHVYAITYMLVPTAFSVSPEVAAQLADWRLRRVLFEQMSFTTLTSIGYSDITPVGSPLYALMWTETIFGQFYMAVVVAQLVGLKLAQALRTETTEDK